MKTLGTPKAPGFTTRLALLAGGCALFLSPLAQADALRAGFGSAGITPPIGMPMAGYYSIRKAQGTLDPLWAHALVIESGKERIALVACDLVGVERATVESARRLIEQQTGIPPRAVMISATHSHTGPLMRSRFLDAADAESKRAAGIYMQELPAKIADAVRMAAGRLSPAAVFGGTGSEPSLAFYRRFHMKDGTVRFNPGKLNPDIVRPAGEPDPDVQVVHIKSVDGPPLATYVNYALHLDTVGGLRFSADYPYTLGGLLRRIASPEMGVMFTIGAAGNINHVDVSTRAPQKGPEEARRIGTVLAGEVIKTLTRLAPVEGPVRARSGIVPLDLPPVTAAEIAEARAMAARFGDPKAPFLDMVRAFKVLDVAEREGRTLDAEVQVIALGSRVAWVAVPGELFVELGRAIKQASPFPQTIIVELANGSISYIPDRKGFREGAYEAISTRFAPGGGELLVDRAAAMLRELFRAAQAGIPAGTPAP